MGLSVAFPGQIQPAFALAYALRARMPKLHVTVGGPALTQMLLRLDGETAARVLGPFSSAVVYEGELALLDMVRALERGLDPCASGRIVRGRTMGDMSLLPPPDFDGLPLERYLAPELVLPYDPTRGCYWGVCTFCHYGLAEVGTAKYRERPTETVGVEHLAAASGAREGEIWGELVHEQRKVSSMAYDALASAVPHASPAPSTWRVVAGEEPERAEREPSRTAKRPAPTAPAAPAKGRRPSHAVNSTKP